MMREAHGVALSVCALLSTDFIGDGFERVVVEICLRDVSLASPESSGTRPGVRPSPEPTIHGFGPSISRYEVHPSGGSPQRLLLERHPVAPLLQFALDLVEVLESDHHQSLAEVRERDVRVEPLL